jgi:hypothetical protein
MKMILLFSHKLTKEQQSDAIATLKVKEFIYLPDNLQSLWSNIPPDIDDLDKFLEPIKDFLKQNVKEGDFVLIQGDFGATYKMVNFVKKLSATPIYATTKRETQEKLIDNKIIKTSIFKHIAFRSY